MSEVQYQGYFDYPPEKMGPMASQYWRDDCKLLGIHLARYKFVSKMLAGKELVAEIGCGDGWFSKIVREQVKELHLYDFDKRFIDGIYNSGVGKAYCHDMLSGRLNYGIYEAVYSLDVLEHFAPKEQKVFLRNLCDSIDDNGCAIIGIPSLNSQKYASPASKAGHHGCLHGDDFKKLLEKYFEHVFMFTMNDEQLGCGFLPMAHYYISICAGVR